MVEGLSFLQQALSTSKTREEKLIILSFSKILKSAKSVNCGLSMLSASFLPKISY